MRLSVFAFLLVIIFVSNVQSNNSIFDSYLTKKINEHEKTLSMIQAKYKNAPKAEQQSNYEILRKQTINELMVMKAAINDKNSSTLKKKFVLYLIRRNMLELENNLILSQSFNVNLPANELNQTKAEIKELRSLEENMEKAISK